MPRGGMRPNSYQAKPGAGRPTIWDEYTAKSKLQKYAPKSFATFGKKAEEDPFFAAKLVNKYVADKHQVEAEVGGSLLIKLDPRGFVPEVGGITTSPAGGDSGPAQVQDAGLAPSGEENDHSDHGAS